MLAKEAELATSSDVEMVELALKRRAEHVSRLSTLSLPPLLHQHLAIIMVNMVPTLLLASTSVFLLLRFFSRATSPTDTLSL